MAQHSGFWNALLQNGEYDRKYNAEDYSDNLAVVISNGVLRSVNDDLKVTANGLVVSVAAGRAWIKGKYYYNDATYSFAAITAPAGGKRYDRVMLRYNKHLETRSITLVYEQGEAANDPVKPEPIRSDNVWDLVLADIFVDTNATSVVITDQRPNKLICGWVYSTAGDNSFLESIDNSFYDWFNNARDTLSSVTLFKRYTYYTTLETETDRATFDIPQYDADTCFLEVYVNGILETRHTVVGNVIIFGGRSLIAGTLVTVKCYKSIDGTGIMSVADEITELQDSVAAMQGNANFTYKLTGLNDNIALSEIAQVLLADDWNVAGISAPALAFLNRLGGEAFFDTLNNNAQITINVVGNNLMCTTPFAGTGSISSRYRWFSFGQITPSEKQIVFDFAHCGQISVSPAANTANIIFFGTDLNVKNAIISAHTDALNCEITAFAGSSDKGTIKVDDCDIAISTTGKAVVAQNGDFTNCHCYCSSSMDSVNLFNCKNDGFIRLQGGTYFAYSAANASAIMSIPSGNDNAVIMAYNINCPKVVWAGYMQQYLCNSASGRIYVNGVVSTLPSNGSFNTINGQIQKSKGV